MELSVVTPSEHELIVEAAESLGEAPIDQHYSASHRGPRAHVVHATGRRRAARAQVVQGLLVGIHAAWIVLIEKTGSAAENVVGARNHGQHPLDAAPRKRNVIVH